MVSARVKQKWSNEMQRFKQKPLASDHKPQSNFKNMKQFSGSNSQTKRPITTIDKSLRDINIRLKNAERDQEYTRKKLYKGNSKVSRKKQDREKQRRSIKSRQENSKGNRRNFKNKSSESVPRFRDGAPAPKDSLRGKEVSNASEKSVPVNGGKDTGNFEEDFGRGHKITLKRRSLNDEKNISENNTPAVNERNESGMEGAAEEKIQKEPVYQNIDSTEISGDQDVNFGRR